MTQSPYKIRISGRVAIIYVEFKGWMQLTMGNDATRDNFSISGQFLFGQRNRLSEMIQIYSS